MSKALIVIDIQNDYLTHGQFPLWNAEAVSLKVEHAIAKAKAEHAHIILVQHVANPANGVSPFFNQNTEGVQIYSRILAAAPDAPIVIKQQADSFNGTNLEDLLAERGVTELVVCGMMTQNCVTHTAISKSAEKYDVTILGDCCTTVSEMLHQIALHALAPRVSLVQSDEAW